MVLNRFNISILIQVILIALVGMLFTAVLTHEFMKMTAAGLFILWSGQIVFLIFYMNRVHRDVARFMEALRNQDTTQFFHRRRTDSYFRKLYSAFNEITGNFRLVRIEKEVENQFFRETIRQSASGIMAADEEGNILVINKAALDIFGIDRLTNMDDLSGNHPGLYRILVNDATREHQAKMITGGKLVHLAVRSSDIKLQEKKVRIWSFLDITMLIDRSELEAWQKLIRVLNHEITNSVVPIHVLASSLNEMFEENTESGKFSGISSQLIDRTFLGLKTIEKRSKGLADFIDTFRNFTSVDKPEFKSVRVSELFDHVLFLMTGELDTSRVKTRIDIIPEDLEFPADEKLIEHTLINLIKNSIHACSGMDNPRISLKGYKSGDRVVLEVTDNGKGIADEIRDQIFTPFFTTREGGSGIGLSLARQVMQMHNGSIRLASTEKGSTTFVLDF